MKNLATHVGIPLLAVSLVSGCDIDGKKSERQQVQIDAQQKQIEELYGKIKEAERAAISGVNYDDLKENIWATRKENNQSSVRILTFDDQEIVSRNIYYGRERTETASIKFPITSFMGYRVFELIKEGGGRSRYSNDGLLLVKSFPDSIETIACLRLNALEEGTKRTYLKNPDFIY